MLDDAQKREALEAARILESPLFRRVFETLDDRYVKAWRGAKSPEDRERCWQRQAALADVQRELFGLVEDANRRANGKDEGIRSARERVKGAFLWRKK